ncbi:MAG: ATP-binding protein [Planctomycetes bacterium]|nr:ATP-binding protein [Planctomycetota bacterium]
MDFIKRSILDVILTRIKQDNVVVITGARQTGKTTLCDNLIPASLSLPFTYISFDDPDERIRFQNSAITILESIDTPLIILDEVQKIPSLFDPFKYVIDKQRRKGSEQKIFILTGSSQLMLMKNIRETLAGRVALFNLYPFSLHEVIGNETVPLLTKIWEENQITGKDVRRFDTLPPEQMRLTVQKRDEHQLWGGYPPVWQRKDASARINWLKDYRRTYIERDISDIGQVANIDTFVLTQKLLCARTAQIFSISEVARDASLAVNTVKRYINLLSMSFQCYLVLPYFENIGKRLIKSPKIYFPDAGLNRAILGEAIINAGAAYESWVFSELIKWKQLQTVEPDLFFYRTSGGLEIDFLLVGDNIILPIEVKAADKASYADGQSLESFMKEHKKVTPLGIILYRGRELKEVRKDIWAIPDWLLFG